MQVDRRSRRFLQVRRQAIMVLAAALLGGIGLVVAGCGSKGGSNAPMSNAAPASATSTTTASMTAPKSPSPGLSLLTSKNCRSLLGLSQAFSTALTGAGQDLAKSAELMKSFADQTPSEIRPDFQVLADAYAKIAAALKGVDLSSGKAPSADVIARLTKLSSQIDTAKVSQASTNISTWATKNCKPK